MSAAAPVAGLGRRLAALALDVLLLAVAGTVLGLLAGPWLSQLGAWGRLLGFAIALAYFAPLNGRPGGGRTLGKRLLGLRVVRADGRAPDLGRSALRFAVLGAPWFLNRLPLPPDALNLPVATVLTVLVFGTGIALVYLWLFNAATRQSLHDFAAGTYVVHGAGAPAAAPVWRGHRWVVAAIFALALATPAALQEMARGYAFEPLLTIRKQMMREPEVRYASVGGELSGNVGSGQSQRNFTALVLLRHHLGDDKPLADRLAGMVLEQYPDADHLDHIDIVLAYGYDIGIATGWLKNEYNGSPQRWRQHLGTVPAAEPAPSPAP